MAISDPIADMLTRIRNAAKAKFNSVDIPGSTLKAEVAKILKNAQAVVSVDTGLSHVAAALEVPMVVLYRVTDPKLVGADGSKVTRLESPCASMYLKSFLNQEQEQKSLQGLSVTDVYQALLQG